MPGNTMKDGVEYPLIHLWCKMMGSTSSYTNNEIDRARQRDLGWRTIVASPTSMDNHVLDDVTSLSTLEVLHDLAVARNWTETAAAIDAHRVRLGQQHDQSQRETR